jgi:hypothetical protein
LLPGLTRVKGRSGPKSLVWGNVSPGL